MRDKFSDLWAKAATQIVVAILLTIGILVLEGLEIGAPEYIKAAWLLIIGYLFKQVTP